MELTLALAQFDLVFGDPAANLARVEAFAAAAAARGAQLLVLPELWSTGYDLTRAEQHATDVDAGVFAAVGALAAEHGLHIVGSALSRMARGVGNTLTWHTAAGERIATYSKLHLFRLMDEDQYLQAGDEPLRVETPWGSAGVAICYDLRFPELFRAYALGGAHFLLLPSEWPHPRLAHWRTLLRARAIENQMYVLACNRVGTVGETVFCGHSAVIDPWGETVIEGGEEEELLLATIDLALVDEVRRRIPIFEDRRPECYGSYAMR
jgi:predicted amidohydrolase